MATKKTPQRIIGKDVTDGITAHLARHLPSPSILLVCDDNTWSAAGEKVSAQASGGYTIIKHSLGKNPQASLVLAEEISTLATQYAGLLAVGSGTVNDITKYAAAVAHKPYVCLATAASMNGYSSARASLVQNGHKQSFPATPPVAIIADTTILNAAPKRLARAGLGDTLCRSTVEADMLLSHHLLGTAYPRTLFDAMRVHESTLIAGAAARGVDASYTDTLITALLDAGDAMTTHGSSAPASQSEHMIAHTLDLLYGRELYNVLHGEMVAVTTLTINQLQHKMLLSQPSVKPLPRAQAQLDRLFGKKLGAELLAHYSKKVLSEEQARDINAHLSNHWPDIKAELQAIMTAPSTIERAFIQSGLSVKEDELGLGAERYRFACNHAYMTRERFTFLDLAVMNEKRVN